MTFSSWFMRNKGLCIPWSPEDHSICRVLKFLVWWVCESLSLFHLDSRHPVDGSKPVLKKRCLGLATLSRASGGQWGLKTTKGGVVGVIGDGEATHGAGVKLSVSKPVHAYAQ